MFGGLGKAKTEFKDFEIILPTKTFDLAGRSFSGAPEWTANIGVTYENNGWFVNVNANYADSYDALTTHGAMACAKEMWALILKTMVAHW